MRLGERGALLLEQLTPYVLSVTVTKETPGSSLTMPVDLHRYRLNGIAVDALLQASNRLYEWQEPELPNDLHFMAGDRACLVVLSDERLGYFTMSPEDEESLRRAMPWLEVRLLEPAAYELRERSREVDAAAP
jgi:hypothetical protein